MTALLNLQDVADRLHCSTRTVRNYIGAGKLKASKFSKRMWRVAEVDLEQFIRWNNTPSRSVHTELSATFRKLPQLSRTSKVG